MRVIAVIGKGGSGKTTSAAAIADEISQTGRVLLVDLDTQPSLSDWLASQRAVDGTLDACGAILGSEDTSEVIVPLRRSQGAHLDLIPVSNARALELEKAIEKRARKRELVVSDWLDQFRGDEETGKEDLYDTVVLDTPRGLGGPLSLNALEAATGVLIPLDPSGMGLDALREQVAIVQQLGEERGLDLLAGVMPTRVPRTSLASAVIDTVEEEGLPMLPAIPSATAVAEAVSVRKLLRDYAPKSPAAKAYRQAAKELLGR